VTAFVSAAYCLQSFFWRVIFFIAIHNHSTPAHQQILGDLLELSRRLDAPLLATNDAHYSRPEDAAAHDVLLCIQTGSLKSDENRLKFHGNDFYVKSASEMRRLFPDDEFPGACDTTLWIVERASVDLEFGKILLPQ